MKGVYVLGLEKGKMYVGFSEDIDHRISQHFAGRGAKWTQKYKPIKVHYILEDGTIEDESKIAKALLNIHGLDIVRGGPYTAVKSDKLWVNQDYISKEYEEPEARYREKECYKCGEDIKIFKTKKLIRMPDEEREEYLGDVHYNGGFIHYTWVNKRKQYEWVNYCPECGATNMG